MFRRLFGWIAVAFIGSCLFLGSWHVLHNDIVFHTDIARDFLVMQEMVATKKPTLIGPRAGGIPGMFHGPLWFYLNLPAFIIGGGNPVFVGWFWVFLTALAVAAVYWAARRLFGPGTALLSALLFAPFVMSYAPALFNSFGALIVFPIFFLFFHRYLESKKARDLLIALFMLGLVIQFQVGFGSAMLVLTVLFLVPYLIRSKRPLHLLSFFILAVPLSTFIAFELRHHFLEISSAVRFFTARHEGASPGFAALAAARLQGMLFNGLGLAPGNALYAAPVTVAFAWLLAQTRNRNFKNRQTYLLYFYFYTGFWALMFLFKGEVWGFFYWPFLPVTIIMASSLSSLIDRRLFALGFTSLLALNFMAGLQSLKDTGQGWALYHRAAQTAYRDAGGREFGYFVFSPDLYAYSGRYALSYTQGEFPGTKSYPYEKKGVTFLFKNTVSPDMKWLSSDWWTTHQVNIASPPVSARKYGNQFTVEEYVITGRDLTLPADPNLIKDLTFR